MRVKELERKSMAIKLDTYSRLQYYGMLGDSYSDVIDYIIDYAESKGLTREELMKVKKKRFSKNSV